MIKVQIGNYINFIGEKPQQSWSRVLQKAVVLSLWDTRGCIGSDAPSGLLLCQAEAGRLGSRPPDLEPSSNYLRGSVPPVKVLTQDLGES